MKFKHFLHISFFFVFLVQCKTLTKSNLQQAQESSTFQVENDSIHKSSVEDAYEKMQSKYLETKLLDNSQVLQT